MLKKTVEYIDFDGNERKEDFYFNLTKAELIKLDLQYDNSLSKHIERLVQTKDIKGISNIFEEIIDMSYGIKSLDGKRFVKTKEALEDFKSTEAYSVIYSELCQDADKASEFINGIVPSNIQQQMAKNLS